MIHSFWFLGANNKDNHVSIGILNNDIEWGKNEWSNVGLSWDWGKYREEFNCDGAYWMEQMKEGKKERVYRAMCETHCFGASLIEA